MDVMRECFTRSGQGNRKGLSLSNSDKVRIRVAKGITPYNSIPQTGSMRRGDFASWFADEVQTSSDKMDGSARSARLAVTSTRSHTLTSQRRMARR